MLLQVTLPQLQDTMAAADFELNPEHMKQLDEVSKIIMDAEPQHPDYIAQFIHSRQAKGCSRKTLEFYKDRLNQFTLAVDYYKATPTAIARRRLRAAQEGANIAP